MTNCGVKLFGFACWKHLKAQGTTLTEPREEPGEYQLKPAIILEDIS